MHADITILCVAGVAGGGSGWGFLLVEPDGEVCEDAGACAEGSTDRMVLRAVVEGLSRCGSGQQVAVRTQSRSLIRTAEDWIGRWQADDWQVEGVSDLRLIQELAELLSRIEVLWVHLSYPQNPADQRARQLARSAAEGPVEDVDPWADDDVFEEAYLPEPAVLPEPLEEPAEEEPVEEAPLEEAAEAAEEAPAAPAEEDGLEDEAPAEVVPAESEDEASSEPPVQLAAPLPAATVFDDIILPAHEPLPAPAPRPPRGFHLLREAPLVPSSSIVEPEIPPDELPDIGASQAIAEAMALAIGPRLVVYVDGALASERSSRGPGGWGFLLIDRKTKRALSRRGGTAWTTVHRMELTAVVEALRSLKGRQQEVEVRTDFRWLVQAGEQWISTWRRQNWTRRNGGEVNNVDLIRQIDSISRQHRISWRWVPEHCEEPGNTFAADLSQRALEEMQIGNRPDRTVRYEESPIDDIF